MLGLEKVFQQNSGLAIPSPTFVNFSLSDALPTPSSPRTIESSWTKNLSTVSFSASTKAPKGTAFETQSLVAFAPQDTPHPTPPLSFEFLLQSHDLEDNAPPGAEDAPAAVKGNEEGSEAAEDTDNEGAEAGGGDEDAEGREDDDVNPGGEGAAGKEGDEEQDEEQDDGPPEDEPSGPANRPRRHLEHINYAKLDNPAARRAAAHIAHLPRPSRTLPIQNALKKAELERCSAYAAQVISQVVEEITETNDPQLRELLSSPKAVDALAALLEDSPTLKQAKNSPEWNFWEKAMGEELDAIETMKTWKLVCRPKDGTNVIPTYYVFKKKRGPDGLVARFKAHLVVQGNRQKEGDYGEIFASVSKASTL
ncbi:hypothetical protein P7C70_g1120, partial [Phenoliferia sp. Uapishka_3]